MGKSGYERHVQLFIGREVLSGQYGLTLRRSTDPRVMEWEPEFFSKDSPESLSGMREYLDEDLSGKVRGLVDRAYDSDVVRDDDKIIPKHVSDETQWFGVVMYSVSDKAVRIARQRLRERATSNR